MDNLLFSKILDSNCNYYGLSSLQLMEAAAFSLSNAIEKDFGNNNNITIFCGLGNNGGDGLALARYLAKKNTVTVYLLGKAEEIKTQQAYRNFLIAKNAKIKIIECENQDDLPKIINSNIIIEAISGSGFSGKLKEPVKSAIKLINSSKAKVIAIDNAIENLKFDKIYSLLVKKHKSAELLDIGIPNELYHFTGPGYVKYLKQRDPKSHKGENGIVLVIGGSKLYHGAVIFAGKAASLFCDLVYILSEKENIPIIKKSSPGFIVSELNKKNVEEFAKKADSILIGPGLAINKKNKTLTNYLLKNFKDKIFILDASAFYLLNKKYLNKNCVLTPHRGEFKKLFKLEPNETNVLKSSKTFNCNILLKAPIDLISDGNFIYYNFSGNEGMTTGGTGDILAGIIAAFSCKNELFHSILAAVFLNGFAGDILKSYIGTNFNAENLLYALPEAKHLCEIFF